MIKITLNEKEYNFPQTWMDVTIGQLQDINNIDVEFDNITKNLSIISILTNSPLEELLDVPATKYGELCELITFLDSQIQDKIYDEWTHDGVTYKFDAEITQYSVSLFLDLEAMGKDGIDNLHMLMAIMYRPLINGKIIKYKASEVVQRAKIFKDNMPISLGVSAQLFMSAFAINTSTVVTKAYSGVENQLND